MQPFMRLGAALISSLFLFACAEASEHADSAHASQTRGAATGAKAAPTLDYEAPRLTPEAIKARMAKGEKLVLVDVRGADAFGLERLPGAVSAPVGELASRYAKLPKDRALVLYCTCLEDYSARRAARDLHKKYGFKRVFVLAGGFDAWVNAGYGFETGKSR